MQEGNLPGCADPVAAMAARRSRGARPSWGEPRPRAPASGLPL